jgi:hypothetical protein
MDKVIAYSVGLLAASVCADNSLTPQEVEDEFNRTNPAGTTNGWKLSEDTHFRQGATNPCPCDQHPETRKHYLFEC